MSKQFESCSLEEATHVAMGGTTYKLGGGEVRAIWNSMKSERVGINIILDDYDLRTIQQDLFPILGIVPYKEKKREPIEFEGIVKQSRLSFLFLDNVPDGIPLGTRFKCVQILEDEK